MDCENCGREKTACNEVKSMVCRDCESYVCKSCTSKLCERPRIIFVDTDGIHCGYPVSKETLDEMKDILVKKWVSDNNSANNEEKV